MKYPGIFILILYSFILCGQNLKNTEWTKIKAERKDGSKIVDRSHLSETLITYKFQESTVTIFSGGDNVYNQKFSIDGRILTIGDFQRYSIDSVNNLGMILTELPHQELSDDKINRFIFLNSQFYFNYLIQKKQITIIADTLVLCNNQFLPTYGKGKLDQTLRLQFEPIKNNILIGSIFLTSTGDITDVQVKPNENFSKKEMDKFIETLRQTSGFWTLPKGVTYHHFKLDFICRFLNNPPLSSIGFIFNTQDPKRFEMTGLTLQQIYEAGEHYSKGFQLVNRDKHDKAIIEFEKCISIDSLYLDAYYNKAYSYLKLGDKKSACSVWQKLKSMGQKEGEKLFLGNCN